MKRINLFFAFLFLLNISYSQTQKVVTDSSDFEADIQYLFDSLDLTEVTAHFFLDKAFPFIDIEKFDGGIKSSIADMDRFGQIYATLYGAVMDTIINFSPPSTYMNAWQTAQSNDTLPLAMVLYDYQLFKEYAIDSNLIDTLNGQFYDVPNRPESPYTQKTVFATTTLKKKVENLDIIYSVPDSLFFSDQTTNVQSIEIDFDDGNGWQSVLWNQSISINYPTDSIKEISIKINLVNGSSLYGYTQVNIDAPPLIENYSDTPDTTISIPPTLDHSGAELDVYLACPSEGLLKPFLFIEGFDPPQDGNVNSNRFKLRLQFEVFEGTGLNLIDYLEAEGYDIIYLDYNNGIDDLYRNVKVVQEAIRAINVTKAANGSDESNVVIGSSMGGLITKYALLEMEDNGEDHDVKIFMTNDSPMRGVNVPLGIQEMVKHVANAPVSNNIDEKPLSEFVPILGVAEDILTSPAAKQMLLYYAYASNGLRSSEHTQFYDDLAQLGESTNFEFIALSNGSVSSTPEQLFDAGDLMILIYGNFNDVLDDVIGWGTIEADIVSGLAHVISVFSVGILNTRVKLDFKVWALPDHPSSLEKIYHGNLIVRILGIKIIKTKQDVSVGGNIQPYDSAPGGIYGRDPSIVPSNLQNIVTIHHGAFCFVPSVSGLSIKKPESDDLFYDLTDYGNVTTNLTALERYDASTDDSIESYGVPQENQEHTNLNTSNAPFLLFEMTSTNGLLGVTSINNRTYNYGESDLPFDQNNPTQIKRTFNQIKTDLLVEGTGQLWVNRDDLIAFTDETNPTNSHNAHFELFIRQGCENPVTLTIQNGGEMLVGEWDNVGNSVDVFVERGGKVFIGNNGKLETDQFSNITIDSAGIIEVASGGTLRLTKGSKLIVNDGGQLIIHPGANIDLWWGDFQYQGNTIEGSSIHIKNGGELIVNGIFDFDGSGFFQFDQGNILTLNSDFELTGMGNSTRFIRLNESATLDIDNNRLFLELGMVEYDNHAAIQIGKNGKVEMSQVNCTGLGTYPDGNIGILAAHPDQIDLYHTDFSRLAMGIAVEYNHTTPPSEFFVNVCDFSNCTIGILANRTSIDFAAPVLQIESCNFDGDLTGNIGLWVENIAEVDLQSSSFINYAFNEASGTEWAAVQLNDVPFFEMSAGFMSDNEKGIFVPITTDENITNIFLLSSATLNDNDIGILLEKGGVSSTNTDYGMVLMDCAKLIDNDVGIQGKDILLNIDACLHSGQIGTCDTTQVRPNVFITPPAALLFDICYQDRDDIDTIIAHGNYWETDDIVGQTPTYFDYLIKSNNDNTPCSVTSVSEILLNTADSLIIEPTNCGGTIIITPTGGLMKTDCLVDSNPTTCLFDVGGSNEFTLNEKFVDAYINFRDTLGGDVSIPYEDLAAIPDSIRDAYCSPCRHYIDVARVFTTGATSSSLAMPFDENQLNASFDKTDADTDLEENTSITSAAIQIAPNPAKDQFTIQMPIADVEVHVMDLLGKVVFQRQGNQRMVVPTDGWTTGVYIVLIKDRTTQQLYRKKVVVGN